MHIRVAVNLLKLFTRRLFCMVVLRFSANEKVENSAERSAPSEASTARLRARKAFRRNSAPHATAITQSNVTRTHTSQRKPPPNAGWPPASPPTRRSPHSPGNASSTEKETLWQKIAAFFTGRSAPETSGVVAAEKQSPPFDGDVIQSKRQARPAGFRKPEIVEVSSPRIYVGNLSFDATEGDLSELFNGVGSVENVEIVSNKHTQKSKGFAFVQMQSIDEAKRAVAELHDKDYMGRKLVVSGAKAVEEKRGERRQAD